MKVFYSGTMTGHHVVGRRSIRLEQGENYIKEYDVAMALIAAKIVQPVDDDVAIEVVARAEPDDQEDEDGYPDIDIDDEPDLQLTDADDDNLSVGGVREDSDHDKGGLDSWRDRDDYAGTKTGKKKN